MSINDYFRILRRWWWILLLLAALTAGSAYVFSAAQTPVNKSTAFVGVQPSRPDFGLSQSTKTLLRYYVSVIDTETFAARVIDRLQLDLAPGQLLADSTISSDDSRFVIQIDVENTNGDLANDIARAWAEEFRAWRDSENATIQREDQVEAVLLDAPHYSLARPKKKINALAGGILGLLLGGVIVFLVEYREASVIRFAEDIERSLALPVLGAIPPAEAAVGGRGRAGRTG
jgi:capsular polysaccharide biosynthesis protein